MFWVSRPVAGGLRQFCLCPGGGLLQPYPAGAVDVFVVADLADEPFFMHDDFFVTAQPCAPPGEGGAGDDQLLHAAHGAQGGQDAVFIQDKLEAGGGGDGGHQVEGLAGGV